MQRFRKKLHILIRRFFKNILEELLYDHKFDLYFLDENDRIIARKKSIPFVPPVGAKIEINEAKSLFVIEDIYIENECGVIYLSGKTIQDKK